MGKALSDDVQKIGQDVSKLGMDLGQTGLDLFQGHYSALSADIQEDKDDLNQLWQDMGSLSDDLWKQLAENLMVPHHDTVKKIYNNAHNAKNNHRADWNKHWGDMMTSVHSPNYGEVAMTTNRTLLGPGQKPREEKPDLPSALQGLYRYVSNGVEWLEAQDLTLVFGMAADVSLVGGASASVGGVYSIEQSRFAAYESVGLSVGLQEGGSLGVSIGLRRGFDTTFGPSIALALHLTIEAGIGVIVYVWPSFLQIQGPWEDGGARVSSTKDWATLINNPLDLFSSDDLQGFDVIIDGGEDLGFSFVAQDIHSSFRPMRK